MTQWIEAECARLAALATYRADRHEIEGFLALFTEDARIDRAGQIFTGREAMLSLMQSRDPARVTRHVLSTPVVEVISASEAKAVAYFVLYEAAAGGAAQGAALALHEPSLLGEYHDQFRRTADSWRLTERRIVIAFQRDAAAS